MLVALLSVPVFAQNTAPASYPVTVSFGTSNVPAVTGFKNPVISRDGLVEIKGYSNGNGAWDYIGTGMSTAVKTTITTKDVWDRPIKSVKLNIKELDGRYINAAQILLTNASDIDDEDYVDFTDDLIDAEAGELTIDVSDIASGFTDYYVTIAINIKKGAPEGEGLQLNSVSYDFSEATATPTIAWPSGTKDTYPVTLVNPNFSDFPREAITTNAGNYTVEYTSSDEDVIKIINFFKRSYELGKAGSAVITATLVDGDTPVEVDGKIVSVSFTVNVTAVTAILSFDTTTPRTAIFGADYTAPVLSKTVNDVAADVPVTYVSSNTSVATVDTDGKITVVGTGSTTITASVTGSDYKASPASYTLTVVPSIKWDSNVADSNTINFGESFTFPKAVAYDDTVTPAIDYTVTGDAVSYNKTTGEFTVAKVGTSTITATGTLNGNTSTLSYTLTVNQSIVSFTFAPKTGKEVYTGDDVALPTFTVKPANVSLSGVEYTTNNPNVSVADGKIHFGDNFNFATDNATIVVTATLPEGNFAEAQTTYTLTLTPAITWESGAVADELYTGTVGETLVAPAAEVNSNKLTLKYSSSNEDVATVNDDGKVTLNAQGTATITATAMNGEKAVQSLSYNVKVAKAYDNGVIYLTSEDFAVGTSRNPRIYAKVAGTEQEISTDFTGTFDNANGVVTVNGGTFAVETNDAAEQAYKTVTVNGTGVGAGTLVTSLFPDFSIISETVESSNGVFTINQPLHDLYYKLENVAASTLTSIEFTPAADQNTINNAMACAVLAVKEGGKDAPDQLKNVEIDGNSFDATSSVNEGAYSKGQAVLVNFKPAEGETVYFICKDGANAYAAPITTAAVLPLNTVYYESDPEIFPGLTPTFAIDWDKVSTTVKTDEFNEYEAGQYIRIGEDRSSGLQVLYYTVNATGESSKLKTISFSGTTGVEDIMVDEEAGEAVYYNLQGVQIAHPAKGQIYVRVMGKKVDKVVF